MIIKKNNNVNIISLIAQTATYVSLPTIHPDSHQGRNVLSHVAACVFLHVTSSHLTARLALLLCIDVDGCLIDTCECVVPWIVSGGLKYIYIYLKKCLIGFWGISAQIIRYETTTYTEQYGLFLWLTKLLAVSTILQTSQ